MNNSRITIPLDRSERSALTKLAEREKRDPRQQAAMLIRQALESVGLLQSGEPGLTDRYSMEK